MALSVSSILPYLSSSSSAACFSPCSSLTRRRKHLPSLCRERVAFSQRCHPLSRCPGSLRSLFPRLLPRASSSDGKFVAAKATDDRAPSDRKVRRDLGPLVPPEFEGAVVVNVEKPTRFGWTAKTLTLPLDSTVVMAITGQMVWEFLCHVFKVLFCVKVSLQIVSEVAKSVLHGWIGIIPLGFAVGVMIARSLAGLFDEEGDLEPADENRPKDPRTFYLAPTLQLWLFGLGLGFWSLKWLGPMAVGGASGYFVAHIATGALWELFALFRGVVHGGEAGPPSERAVRKAIGLDTYDSLDRGAYE